jgi:cytochrome P450
LLFSITNIPTWVPRPKGARTRDAIRTLRSAVLGLIAKRRGSGKPQIDLMQRLMEAKDPETGRPMSDEQLVDNLLTFYLAGHETTAKALTWTLYLLSRAPQWEQRVLDEVRAVVGDGPVTSAHVEKLAITQQVLKESMRLFPPAPQIGRHALKDHQFGPHEIKAGTQILIPIYAVQRHRKYFPDPDQFDPTRFAPENESKISRYHYMPFGAGPRICIGMAFAMMEATIILATLIRGARFTSAPDLAPEPVARVTLVPKGGMPMRVTRRV